MIIAAMTAMIRTEIHTSTPSRSQYVTRSCARSDRPKLLSSRFTLVIDTNTKVVVTVTSRHHGHRAPIWKYAS